MIVKTTVAALATTLALSGAAAAHATLEQRQAAIGSTTKLTLRVPHGCGTEATHTVRIEIPEGVYNVKPMPKAGWDLSVETGAYATPYNNHGTQMTEGVRAVVWSGGDLPNAFYDEFTVRGAIGPDLAEGTQLFFPAVQTCATGVADWTDTSGSHDVPNPAPKLTVVAGAAPAQGHGHAHGAETQAEATVLGDLMLEAPFARATLPNQPVGGGFVTIHNQGATADRLISASAPVAARVEIHEMAMEGDIMRMRELSEGLPLPAGETVTLKPGGFHLMFMGLTGPLVAGETTEVTLVFEQAGEITLPLPILARDAKGGAMDHSQHGGH